VATRDIIRGRRRGRFAAGTVRSALDARPNRPSTPPAPQVEPGGLPDPTEPPHLVTAQTPAKFIPDRRSDTDLSYGPADLDCGCRSAGSFGHGDEGEKDGDALLGV